MCDRAFNAEEWRLMDSIIRPDISRKSVIISALLNNKYTWLCPVDKCDRIYGNKQRLKRHLEKEHPDAAGNGSIDKSNVKYMEKLVAVMGMGVERHPVAFSGGSNGNQMQVPVNAPQLSGLSPGSSPGYFDSRQTQSPSSNDGVIFSPSDQGPGPLYPAALGNLPSGADGYSVSPNAASAPRNQPSWMNTGSAPGTTQMPYGQSCPNNADPSGPWSNSLAQQEYAIDSMTSGASSAGFNTQLTALNFPVPAPMNQEYHTNYDQQQQYPYQQQNLDHVPTQHQGRHWRQ